MSILYELTPQALSDLDEIWIYIARDSPDAADRVELSVLNACEHIAQFPLAGVERPELGAPPLRFWTVTKFPNYMIAYLPATKPLQVIAVLQGNRNVRSVVVSRSKGR